jgi:hypothetical protein
MFPRNSKNNKEKWQRKNYINAEQYNAYDEAGIKQEKYSGHAYKLYEKLRHDYTLFTDLNIRKWWRYHKIRGYYVYSSYDGFMMVMLSIWKKIKEYFCKHDYRVYEFDYHSGSTVLECSKCCKKIVE